VTEPLVIQQQEDVDVTHGPLTVVPDLERNHSSAWPFAAAPVEGDLQHCSSPPKLKQDGHHTDDYGRD
jgi:hypothetical protein